MLLTIKAINIFVVCTATHSLAATTNDIHPTNTGVELLQKSILLNYFNLIVFLMYMTLNFQELGKILLDLLELKAVLQHLEILMSLLSMAVTSKSSTYIPIDMHSFPTHLLNAHGSVSFAVYPGS